MSLPWFCCLIWERGLPRWRSGEKSAYQCRRGRHRDAREAGWVQSLDQEEMKWVGNDNSLQYFCLENSLDRGAWWATVHGVAKSDTSEHTHTYMGKGMEWHLHDCLRLSLTIQLMLKPRQLLLCHWFQKKQAINNMDPIVTRKWLQLKDYNYKQQLKKTQKLILS